MSFYVCSITEFKKEKYNRGIELLKQMTIYFRNKYDGISVFNIHKVKSSNEIIFYECFDNEDLFRRQSIEFLQLGKENGLFDLVEGGYNPDTGVGNWKVYFMNPPFSK